MAVDAKRLSDVRRGLARVIGPIAFLGVLWHFFGLQVVAVAVPLFVVFHVWGRLEKRYALLRSPVAKGVGAGICLGLIRFIRWSEPLDVKTAAWLVASTIVLIPVFAVWSHIESEHPRHEGLWLAAHILGWLLIGLLSAVTFLVIEWLAGDL